jgi:hypothetical protein
MESKMNTNILGDDWNEEDYNDEVSTSIQELENLTVYSRDWTVETVVNQIMLGNIDLNPKFQRRNAWNDIRRSRLIESLITGMPVPEIVLAENPNKKGAFIVIDGKQRLTSIIGFVKSSDYSFWDKPVLKDLKIRNDLNGLSFTDIQSRPKLDTESRRLMNEDIRCTVITNFQDQDVLYDIFYRLNSGSVPLSSQELRQVLNKGEFADYLIEITNTVQPIHDVMGLNEPDNRLRDIEIILRFIAVYFMGDQYRGNLRLFLDKSMQDINREWSVYRTKVDKLYKQFNDAIGLLEEILGKENVGRKYSNGEWEHRFNKVLFEVEVYYFIHLLNENIDTRSKAKFAKEFRNLCANDTQFRDSIESSTKDVNRYKTRFIKFQGLVNSAFKTTIDEIPIG